MSESTVDRHVYMFLNRMVYTTYNHTDLEAIKVEYTHAHAHAHTHTSSRSNTDNSKYSDFKTLL